MKRTIRIHNRLSIPERELRFRFSRSRGPGGQHVNKTATRVELLFDVRNSPTLSTVQRERILNRLSNRISSEGILRVDVQQARSQLKNREIAIERFRDLLKTALRQSRPRIPTKPTGIAREKRIEGKKRRGQIKKSRRPPSD
jgi:ribosome-associated protein